MGKFIVKETNTGIKFDLMGADDTVLLTSEVYTGERACHNGIASVKKSCLGGIEDQTAEGFEALAHPKFEVYNDQGGKIRFRLKAVNGQIIAVSKPYADKEECLGAIAAIQAAAPDAPVAQAE